MVNVLVHDNDSPRSCNSSRLVFCVDAFSLSISTSKSELLNSELLILFLTQCLTILISGESVCHSMF